MIIKETKAFLLDLFKEAIAAADPAILMAGYMPKKPKGRTVVIGLGKASGAMALAFESEWFAAGNGEVEGLIVTSKGNGKKLKNIKTIIASHPIPDENSSIAARQMIELVSGLTKDDLVVALISGGGSALLSLANGISADEKQAVNKALLNNGVPIAKMNCIRKHLSNVKGGRLAKLAYPAKLVSLVISDVVGNDPALVASGPTIADETTRYDALKIIKDYQLDLPKAAIAWLNNPKSEAPKPSEKYFVNNEIHIIANANMSLKAAAKMAEQWGVKAYIISDAIEGEASIVGFEHAELALQISKGNERFEKPCVILSGGETTVSLRHKGKGGRNSEYLLSLALGIHGVDNVFALAADTDGIDGSENNAGAYADGASVERMKKAGVLAKQYLQKNNAYSAFEAVNDLIVTGATATNVNDFRAILIG